MFINKFIYSYFIAVSIIYGLTAFGFLFKVFNPAQKALSKVLRQQPFYGYLKFTYGIISFGICLLWVYNFDQVKKQLEHIDSHLDKTTLEYIEDKEDLYRDERNLYLYAGAFFVTLANLRIFSLIHDYYESFDRTEIAQKKIKEQ
ncbi:unnamed protein product (macronuclear) [Paramecium tetraurelia]|uniref:BAP29/BAP31 transmembrane domain-containing protein n=1 Tax=Paramecium tetraurelia TaxID=5888 RepID=A0DSH8_PARTE|nr:uncharacterized protein GSPATT00019699001 [Paramecium tetraurelia]CAK85995.1 unnamed protein product [Paramecium tetraurelia]|eukprot:XP_001453392.1 hypothetical protein (macronuclear) [Paramecium tetraurelia strain d4-2]